MPGHNPVQLQKHFDKRVKDLKRSDVSRTSVPNIESQIDQSEQRREKGEGRRAKKSAFKNASAFAIGSSIKAYGTE